MGWGGEARMVRRRRLRLGQRQAGERQGLVSFGLLSLFLGAWGKNWVGGDGEWEIDGKKDGLIANLVLAHSSGIRRG